MYEGVKIARSDCHGEGPQGLAGGTVPMLALTRRIGEEVVIGDPKDPLGVIRVVDIHGDKVRLAFDFPRDCQINRRELADQKAAGVEKPDGK
ncbi:carbon storage regulator [Poriferisphaera sp. WC338]|uniref:carbon storage regulator n=1 Tax=Poriferisphaera sp. WC338 TaxID=3425129 RepID=UPI003D816E05